MIGPFAGGCSNTADAAVPYGYASGTRPSWSTGCHTGGHDAAHMMTMSTQNPAENRSRQPEGAPNSTGGQFATEAKTEAPVDAVATPQPIVFTADYDVIAKRNTAAYAKLRDAKREIHTTGAAAIAQLVLSAYPDAARVRLGDSDQYDGFDIDGILDAHGNDLVDSLWDDEDYSDISDGLSDAVQDIPTTVSYLETGQAEYPWYVEEPIEGHRGHTTYIDLAKAIDEYEKTAALGHLHVAAHEAGLEMMGGVFDVLYNREEIPDERLLQVTADDVDTWYTAHIGPAIDGIENGLK